MIHSRSVAPLLTAAALAIALVPSLGHAQVCLGIPAEEGQISLQGEVLSNGTVNSYGGRLGLNFNTEYAFDVTLRRPHTDAGNGLVLSSLIAYEMDLYEPPVCFTFGVRYERHPVAEDEDRSETLIPIGIGIGKRLGSSKGLSLALFLRPEYMIRLRPNPDREFDSFWDELGHRSEGRGVIGLLAATPFLYATGSIEIETPDYEPTFSIGLGVTF
jgi:hypothetical protein